MRKVKIQIFDPPMCCPTGICGPAIEPVLVGVHEAIERIAKEYQGRVEIKRHLFGKDVQPFLSNKQVLGLIRERGPAALPITVVDSEIIKSGSYPSYEELLSIVKDKV